MKKVKVEEAVGAVLAHDITEIIPGKKKDVAFEKGHVIEKADIEKLLNIGKKHLFVFDNAIEGIHEDEAGMRIARAISGDHMKLLPPKEGKVTIARTVDGLFTVDRESLYALNSVEDVLVSTLPNRYPVKTGDQIAAARIIPLYIDEKNLEHVEKNWSGTNLICIKPFRATSVGLVVTGSEVYEGRIPDSSHIVEKKLMNYGARIAGKTVATDDVTMIRDAITGLFEKGADMVITTAGLSVDPDDVTREGIEATGAKTIFYGTPVSPGAMFLVATLNGKYVLGAPACVYFNGFTALDLVIIRLLAGEEVSKADIAALGYGGFCSHCEVCHYPACYYGKG
ncbi:MAG: molybdopterin-binding protein [Syntrophorhabdus sp.]